jgi:pleiotropic regulator 1
MGKCVKTLTNHKKGIRALAIHPEEYTFASAAADNVKVTLNILDLEMP